MGFMNNGITRFFLPCKGLREKRFGHFGCEVVFQWVRVNFGGVEFLSGDNLFLKRFALQDKKWWSKTLKTAKCVLTSDSLSVSPGGEGAVKPSYGPPKTWNWPDPGTTGPSVKIMMMTRKLYFFIISLNLSFPIKRISFIGISIPS